MFDSLNPLNYSDSTLDAGVIIAQQLSMREYDYDMFQTEVKILFVLMHLYQTSLCIENWENGQD